MGAVAELDPVDVVTNRRAYALDLDHASGRGPNGIAVRGPWGSVCLNVSTTRTEQT
jgi:hypothetical protein